MFFFYGCDAVIKCGNVWGVGDFRYVGGFRDGLGDVFEARCGGGFTGDYCRVQEKARSPSATPDMILYALGPGEFGYFGFVLEGLF